MLRYKNLNLILALNLNDVLGDKNTLIWRCKTDLKWFKTLTYGRTLLMGRNTAQSLKKPLIGRNNFVLSSKPINGFFQTSWEDFIKMVERNPQEEFFICGGKSIYELALPIASTIYFTRINSYEDGDTILPNWESKMLTNNFYPELIINSFEQNDSNSASGNIVKWICK